MELFAHPFSPYSWKALFALYERGIAFDFRFQVRLRAYRARLLARPSVARAVDGARP